MKCQDISINYEIIGEGLPIVMIHGFAPDLRLMKGCMEPLFKREKGWKRIYFDLPGMGQSGGSESIVSSDHMLDIVCDFISQVIPSGLFLLAGESYGGYLSQGVIYRMKERVAGVMYICPVITADSEKRDLPLHEIILKDETLLAELSPRDAKMFSQFSVVQNRHIYKRYEEEILCGLNISDRILLKRVQENYTLSFEENLMNMTYEKPSLFILGRQDSVTGYSDAFNMIKNYSRGTFALLDKAGHNLQIEQEELFTSLACEWLSRVREFHEK